jgi:hypothetical protein
MWYFILLGGGGGSSRSSSISRHSMRCFVMCRSVKMLQCLQRNALVSFKVDGASPAYLDMVQQKGSLSCLEGLSFSMRGSFTSECLPVGSTTRPCVHHQALEAASKRTLPLLQLPSVAPGGLPTTDLQHSVQPHVSYRPRSARCGGSLSVIQHLKLH